MAARHAVKKIESMVERTVGNKRGAADSDGVAYLKSPLSKVLFPDLWAIRRAL